jgi:hypothetical protein
LTHSRTRGSRTGPATSSFQANDRVSNWSGVDTNTVLVDVTGPAGAIGDPASGTPVAGDVTVTGTASDDISFLDYTLDYGAGTSPSSWTEITTSTTPVPTLDTLGTWSTGALEAGPYTCASPCDGAQPARGRHPPGLRRQLPARRRGLPHPRAVRCGG